MRVSINEGIQFSPLIILVVAMMYSAGPTIEKFMPLPSGIPPLVQIKLILSFIRTIRFNKDKFTI